METLEEKAKSLGLEKGYYLLLMEILFPQGEKENDIL